MKEVFTDTETESRADNSVIMKKGDGKWYLYIFVFPYVWEFFKAYKSRKDAKNAAQKIDRSIEGRKMR